MTQPFQYSGDDVLDVMSRFALNRNAGIENLITNYFQLDKLTSAKRILEFGAGKGEFINRFKKYHQLITYAVDLDENYKNLLDKSHSAFQRIEEVPVQVEFAYAIDVLEHIEDDVDALKKLHSVLTPKGKILIYVPARPELYSEFDKQIGHYRRYTLNELASKAKVAGFTIDTLKYHDFLGYFAAFYNKLFYNKHKGLNVNAVKLYDKLIFPTSEFIEKVLRKPFIGKDIFLVAHT
jgi:SAM-dependent methyltransferase